MHLIGAGNEDGEGFQGCPGRFEAGEAGKESCGRDEITKAL